MKCILIAVLISLVVPFLYSEDDDLEFAISLEKAGYSWMAQEIFSSLMEDMDVEGKIRIHLILAKMHNEEGNEEKRNREYEMIIGLGTGLNLPVVKKVELKLNTIRENAVYTAIQKLEGKAKDKVEEKEKEGIRAELEKNIDGVISYYKKQSEEDGKNTKSAKGHLISLAKAMYYKSFAYKGADKTKHNAFLKDLNNTHFKPVPQEETASPIDIPFFRGLTFEQMGNPKNAAFAFLGCLRYPTYSSLYPARRNAYFHAVSDFYSAGMFKECAEVAFVYMDQFPVRTGSSASDTESMFISQVNSSMDTLKKTDPDAYNNVVRLVRMRTNCVLTVRATRVSVENVRRYRVTGSGGSSAFIEMPEQKVTKVNTTVAIPSR
ncbi:hypothetical protein ACFL6F_01100 [Planctomycetota bacterium]